jgi:hypothetical protein
MYSAVDFKVGGLVKPIRKSTILIGRITVVIIPQWTGYPPYKDKVWVEVANAGPIPPWGKPDTGWGYSSEVRWSFAATELIPITEEEAALYVLAEI